MPQDTKIPFCCSKFSWARERISPKIIDSLDTRSQKGSPALDYVNNYLKEICFLRGLKNATYRLPM
jgi:hypothetical protein